MFRCVTSRKAGFTLIEMMIVVVIIGVLLSVAAASFTKARDSTRLKSCLKNMQHISWAKDQYAIEASKRDGDPVDITDLVPTYIKKDPQCPASGTYTPGAIGADVQCTFATHHN